MKVAAYIALHYGKDYLDYAIRSVIDHVDAIFVLYTDKSSHGYPSSMQCPDSKQELIEICEKYDKITIYQGGWTYENQQRNYGYNLAKQKGFDILIALDADEVWDSVYLSELIKEVYDRKASKCLVWMRHLWRSFNYICDDPMRQERIYYLNDDKQDIIYADKPLNQVWHFGYARQIDQIRYKISCHGHSGEWLTSKLEWLEKKYMPFPPEKNVHPTCDNTWNPEPFDKTLLPKIMTNHPYYNLESID